MNFKKLNQLNGYYFEITFFYNFLFDVNRNMVDFHSHNCLELMYCKENFFHLYVIADGTEKKVTIKKNQLVIIAPGVPHKTAFVPEILPRILNLEYEVKSSEKSQLGLSIKDLFSSTAVLKNYQSLSPDFLVVNDYNCVLSDMEDLVEDCAKYDFGTESMFRIRILSFKLFLDISRCMANVQTKKTGIIYIKRALDFIKTNFFKEISVNAVACECGLNPSYLQRLFKQYLGTTIMLNINGERIKYARQLLINASVSLQKVAEICGYKSRHAFIFEFKKITGDTPTDFRQKLANANIFFIVNPDL